MKVINSWGTEIDYVSSVEYMDDELREELASELAPCTEQDFFAAYEEAHKKKFGAVWELSKKNPCW